MMGFRSDSGVVCLMVGFAELMLKLAQASGPT